ncbi:MAG: carbohydrate-binding domain-containing protein, partial [Bacteroidota bacterium]|nr:carbohydrate-binding domain-containing protein [Bacteroidota bacterium]
VHAGSYDYDPTTHVVNDSYISGGTLTITTTGSESNDVSSKGIKVGWVTKNGSGERATVTGYGGSLKISGGKVIVKVSKSEGIEAKGNIVISGGETYVYSTGDDAINSQAEFDVTGGYVYAHSTANDAMDANHDLKISGGYVFAVTTKGSPEVAIDANTEENYKLYITGGVVVAYGGLESGYSSSNTVYTLSGTANAWNALYDGSSFIAAFKAPSNLSSFAVCAPSLSKGYKGVNVGGTTYCNGIWATSDISGGTAVSLTTYSGGNGGGPGGGGRW